MFYGSRGRCRGFPSPSFVYFIYIYIYYPVGGWMCGWAGGGDGALVRVEVTVSLRFLY